MRPLNFGSPTSGGASGAGLPGITDVVCFDASSGTGTSVVDQPFQIYSIDFTGGGISNSDMARRVFREHPEMLIRENHVAVFQANWNDKATNLKAIACELSLGMDSLVFLDDNPVERGLIRQMLPEVPELPDDPALYARTLAAAGYFDSIVFSDEDKKRAEFYQQNFRRTRQDVPLPTG
jgi:hypothetical protein